MGLRKLFGIITILLVLLIINSSTLLIVSTTRLHKKASQLADAVESIHTAGQLEIRLLTHNRESFLWQATGKQEHYNNKEEEKNELYLLLEKNLRLSESDTERKIINRLEYAIADYFNTRQYLETKNISPIELYKRVPAALDNVFLLTGELIQLNRQRAESSEAKMDRQNKIANALGISISLFALLIMSTFLILVKHVLYNPIMQFRDTISRFTFSNSNIKATEKGPKEIKEIIKTFNNMSQRLTKQREAQYRFLAAIAHDLKNPISAIALSSQVLMEQEVKAETKSMIDVIQRQAKHLNRLVGDLLDTASIEAGKLELQKKHEDITRIVIDAVDLYRSTSSIHKINLNTPDHPVYSMIDSVRISQVINNLLSNAIKYSPSGGTIDVEITQQLNEIVISVKDEGIGISEEEKEQIFEPFKRTEKTRDTIPGVGLGLSVVKRIIEEHGGKIEVKNGVNAGANFLIHLPV